LRALRSAPLVASLALAVPLLVVKAWRWRRLLGAYGSRVSRLEAFELYVIAAGAGALTPGAIGDFSKGLSPAIGRRSVGLWASAVDRLYDVAMLLLLGTVVASFWLQQPAGRVLSLIGLTVALVAAWHFRPHLSAFATARLGLPAEPTALDATAPAAVWATLLATLLAFVRFALLVAALGIQLGWEQIATAFVLTSGIAALPLSIAGVGTRDVLLIGYLRGYGVSAAQAVALSSLCLLLFLANGVLAGCLWIVRPPIARRSG